MHDPLDNPEIAAANQASGGAGWVPLGSAPLFSACRHIPMPRVQSAHGASSSLALANGPAFGWPSVPACLPAAMLPSPLRADARVGARFS